MFDGAAIVSPVATAGINFIDYTTNVFITLQLQNMARLDISRDSYMYVATYVVV